MASMEEIFQKCFDATTGKLRVSGAGLSETNSLATTWTLYPSGETDDGFSFSVTAGRPLFAPVGSYLVLGADGTPGSATTDGDVYIKQALEVDGVLYAENTTTLKTGNGLYFGGDGARPGIMEAATDSNAKSLNIGLNSGGAADVPVIVISDYDGGLDFGLFDGLTQPVVAIIEKAEQLHTATNGIADAGAASAILKHVGGFTAAVVGDIVRITAGTLCTAGWYWITTVTSADQVTLDRNYTSGDTTNVTFVTYHPFTMVTPQAIYTRITDGAPDDSMIEMDMAGALILDVGQANGRLYWRTGSAWHYVDATAGLSLPKEERIDPTGHEFQIGDEVKLIVDRINDDGSFHAYPYYRGV